MADNPDTNMDEIDASFFRLAAMLDSTVRFHVGNIKLDELSLIHI